MTLGIDMTWLISWTNCKKHVFHRFMFSLNEDISFLPLLIHILQQHVASSVQNAQKLVRKGGHCPLSQLGQDPCLPNHTPTHTHTRLEWRRNKGNCGRSLNFRVHYSLCSLPSPSFPPVYTHYIHTVWQSPSYLQSAVVCRCHQRLSPFLSPPFSESFLIWPGYATVFDNILLKVLIYEIEKAALRIWLTLLNLR